MRKILGAAVVLTLLLGLGLAACRIPGTDPPIWHREDLTALNVDIGANWGLFGVDAAGWAVGLTYLGGDLGTRPLVLHRSGGQWRVEDIGEFADLEGVLVGVGVAPNGDVWCVGSAMNETWDALLLVKTGGTWTRLTAPVGAVWPLALADVAFEDAHNAYVVGGPSVLRFVDRVFVEEFAPDGTVLAIDWADQGYASGEIGPAAIWQSTTTIPFGTNVIAKLNLQGELRGIDVLGDGTGWAVGFNDAASTGEHTVFVRREGGEWAADTRFQSDAELNDVATLSETRAFVVGQEGSDGLILSYVADREVDGQPMPWAYETGAMNLVSGEEVYGWVLNGISASSEKRAFAVGFLEDNSDPPNTMGVILRYE